MSMTPPTSISFAKPTHLEDTSHKKRHPEGTYKTKPCLNWAKSGSCPYGRKCQFAHGQAELRSKRQAHRQESSTPLLTPEEITPPTSPKPLANVNEAELAGVTCFMSRCQFASDDFQGLPAPLLAPPPLPSPLLAPPPLPPSLLAPPPLPPPLLAPPPLDRAEPPLARRNISFATNQVGDVVGQVLGEEKGALLHHLLQIGDGESMPPPPPSPVDCYQHGIQGYPQHLMAQSVVVAQPRVAHACRRDANWGIAAGAA